MISFIVKLFKGKETATPATTNATKPQKHSGIKEEDNMENSAYPYEYGYFLMWI